jgi:hypothetical protein
MTGEAAALKAQEDAWNQTSKALDEARKKRDEYQKLGQDGMKDFAAQKITEQQAAVLAGMPDGIDKQLQQIQYETQNKLQKLNDDFAKYAATDAIAALEKQLAEVKQGLEDSDTPDAMRSDLLEKQNNINVQLQQLYANREALTAQYWQIETSISAEGVAKQHEAQNKANEERLKEQQEADQKLQEQAEKNRDHLAEVGKGLTESLRTPAEAYAAEIMKLDELLQTNAITLDTWKRGAAKAMKDLDATAATHADYKAPDVGEVRARGQVTSAPQLANPNKNLEQTAIQLLEEQRKANRLTEQQIRDRKSGAVVVQF